VTRGVPAAARRILDDGVLCHIAARTPAGPHVTPVVFAFDGGRVWVTTSRSSVKAKAWRRDRRVAGLVQAGDVALLFRGEIRTYDAFDPLSWPAATVAGPRLVRAAARFSLKNARFFAGYAVDVSRVPFAWSPPGRVFAGVSVSAGAVVTAGTGTVLHTWGPWEGPAAPEARYRSPERRRSLDLRVPAPVRRAVGTRGRGALALPGPDEELTVVPVAWRRAGSENLYEAAIPAGLFALAAPASGSRGALAVDRSSRWRAAEMVGILLQGQVRVFEPSPRGRQAERLRALDPAHTGGAALARLRPDRVAWWEGWTSATVRA
jgi:hypothetical protein